MRTATTQPSQRGMFVARWQADRDSSSFSILRSFFHCQSLQIT